MKYLNKIATVFCSAALGLVSLTSCEGGDLFSINGPDWMAERIDSIANAKSQGGEEEEEIEGMHEDVYNIGKEDLSSGFWTLGKTYVVPAGEKWQAQFNLTVNPDNVYYKNCYIVFNDYNPDSDDHLGTEYGVIRYDNDPNKNSEWGDNIDRSLVKANFENSSGDDSKDASVQKMNGKVTVTVDRTEGGIHYTISNGNLTKEYIQSGAFPSTDPEGRLCCRIGIEGALVSFLGSTIEPIGGYTSAEDKEPVSLEISGVPGEVLVGTPLKDAMANVVGVVTFTEGVTKNVTAADLEFKTIPDYESLGQKTLVAVYNKTFKGALSSTTAVAVKTFSVVNELSAYTQTVVVPNPLVLGAEDNTQAWWTVHTENIKVDPKETKVVNFTNYTSGENNWNNFVIVLNKEDLTEYAVVRADNWGWGDGYGACKTVGGFASDEEWAAWRAAMNGAKVTAYITNNGDGTADIKAVMVGNNGQTYVQEYNGINTVNPDDMYFRFTVDGSHIVFDNELGASDCSTAWWTEFTPNVQVRAHQVCTVNFTNYTSGANNWNNFVIILNKEDLSEYAVVRADNWGWGDGYDACTPSGGQADWATWLSAMNGAKCTAQIVNNGDGTVDVKIIMHGTDGVDYLQDYIGINTIDPDNFYFRYTVDGSHLVFE